MALEVHPDSRSRAEIPAEAESGFGGYAPGSGDNSRDAVGGNLQLERQGVRRHSARRQFVRERKARMDRREPEPRDGAAKARRDLGIRLILAGGDSWPNSGISPRVTLC